MNDKEPWSIPYITGKSSSVHELCCRFCRVESRKENIRIMDPNGRPGGAFFKDVSDLHRRRRTSLIFKLFQTFSKVGMGDCLSDCVFLGAYCVNIKNVASSVSVFDDSGSVQNFHSDSVLVSMILWSRVRVLRR